MSAPAPAPSVPSSSPSPAPSPPPPGSPPAALASPADERIIDLAQFDHGPRTNAPATSEEPPQPGQQPLFAQGFMRKIFTVVPPSPPSGAPSATTAAAVGAQLRQKAPSPAPPSSVRSSISLDRQRSAAGKEGEVAQRSVGSALDGLRSSIDLSALPSWLGGGATAMPKHPPSAAPATAKGGERQTAKISSSRTSFDDAPGPLLRSMPAAAHAARAEHHAPTPRKPPPSLITSFPSFGGSTAQVEHTSSTPALSEKLKEALHEPLAPPGKESSPLQSAGQARSQSSPDVPLAMQSLYASAAPPEATPTTTASFLPPFPLAPPPRAHLDASAGPSSPPMLNARRPPAHAHARQPSLSQRNATAIATAAFFNPSSRAGSPTLPQGFGSSAGGGAPYLQRSATLNSIDHLRYVQRRSSGGSGAPEQLRRVSQSSGWWREHKAMVDGMLKDEDKADTVEGEEEVIAKRHRAPKNPVVFCHGLFGFDHLGPASLPALQISHWRGIKEVLEGNGTEVFIARVPATSSIEERARTLRAAIEDHFPGRTVNLIGHSMGGLDCRYLISKLKPFNFKVASLTTIATPHRGSAFADHLIDDIIGQTNMPSVLSMLDVIRLPNQGDGQAFDALSTRAMRGFNLDVTDDAEVKYYSWGAKFDPSYFNTFKWSHSVILAKEGPNDGLVSVSSASWGEYQGTLENVNHLDLVGWVNPVRYTLSEWVGKPISFKPASFYLDVADHLAKEGF